jgi:hypothetical protein
MRRTAPKGSKRIGAVQFNAGFFKLGAAHEQLFMCSDHDIRQLLLFPYLFTSSRRQGFCAGYIC